MPLELPSAEHRFRVRMCDVPFPESTSEEVKDFIDKQKAKFKAECDAGQGAACYEYARLQVSADKDVKAAMQTLTRGCSELANSASCGSLAALFSTWHHFCAGEC